MTAKLAKIRPPVVERIVAIYCKPDEDKFQANLTLWLDQIRKEFPIDATATSWDIPIEYKVKDHVTVPVLSSLYPKARFIPRYWKRHPEGLKLFGFDVRADRLVFRVAYDPTSQHTFDEIIEEMKEWGPKWMEQFGVRSLTGVTVEYVNYLSPLTTPQFSTPDNRGLSLGSAIRIFADIPGGHIRLTAPFDCKIGLLYDEETPYVCNVSVIGPPQEQSTIHVLISVDTQKAGKQISLEQALIEVRKGREIANHQFRSIFTKFALDSFYA